MDLHVSALLPPPVYPGIPCPGWGGGPDENRTLTDVTEHDQLTVD